MKILVLILVSLHPSLLSLLFILSIFQTVFLNLKLQRLLNIIDELLALWCELSRWTNLNALSKLGC